MSAGRWSDSGSLSADLDGWDVASGGGDMLAGWDDDPTIGPEVGETTEDDSPNALSDEWRWGDSTGEDVGEDSGSAPEDATPAPRADSETVIAEPALDAMPSSVHEPEAAVDDDVELVEPSASASVSDYDYQLQRLEHVAESYADADSPVDPDSGSTMNTPVTSRPRRTPRRATTDPTMDAPDTPAGYGPSLSPAAGSGDAVVGHPAFARPEDRHVGSEQTAGSATGRLTPPMADPEDHADELRPAAPDGLRPAAPLFDVPVIHPPVDHAPMGRPVAGLTPVSEPPLMAGDDEEEELQMFLGDEQDYVLEQDLRNKTRAEAAARNAFRMHRPPVRSARPVPVSEQVADDGEPRRLRPPVAIAPSEPVADGGEGWGYGGHAAPSDAGDYGYSGQPTPDRGLGGLEAARPVDAMRTVGDEAPIEASSIDDPTATEPAGDRGPALDYDGLLNEMNAGSDDYLNLDSPAVLAGDEEEDLDGPAEADGDEVDGRLAYAERVASLSKSRPSAGGADMSSPGSAGVDDAGDEGDGPADADDGSEGETDKKEDSARGGGRLRKIGDSIGGKLHALMAQAKSEIGAGADDSTADSEPDRAPAESHGKRKSKSAVKDSPSAGNGKGKSGSVLGALDAVLRKIRAVRRSWRIASALSLVFVGLWTSLNIPAAVDKGGANGAAVDEGSVKVAAARWTGSAVEVTLRNDSEMVAHVSGSAAVRSWSPSASPTSWIGARTTATCELPSTDVDPGATVTVSSIKCDAEPTGIWHRVKATLEYE